MKFTYKTLRQAAATLVFTGLGALGCENPGASCSTLPDAGQVDGTVMPVINSTAKSAEVILDGGGTTTDAASSYYDKQELSDARSDASALSSIDAGSSASVVISADAGSSSLESAGADLDAGGPEFKPLSLETIDGDPEKLKKFIENMIVQQKNSVCGDGVLNVFCNQDMIFQRPFGVKAAFWNSQQQMWFPVTKNVGDAENSSEVRIEGVVNGNTNPALMVFQFYDSDLKNSDMGLRLKFKISDGHERKWQYLFDTKDGKIESQLNVALQQAFPGQMQAQVALYVPDQPVHIDNRKHSVAYLWVKFSGAVSETNPLARAVTIMPCYSSKGYPNNFMDGRSKEVALYLPTGRASTGF